MATISPNYGISRIDQAEKKNHGFYVRITHRGKTTQKFFPDKSHGGKAKALRSAKDFRDRAFSKLPKSRREAAANRRNKIKQSGVTGVTHVVSKSAAGKVYEYWQAAWTERGKRKTAKFSITRYGDSKALELAKRAKNKNG
jgi:hypothetical protein